LLHRAYAELAEMGLRFMATHQSSDVTRERCERGECWVAEAEGRIVGTVVYYSPRRSGGCPWYDRPDVASFGQLGVEPASRSQGIGTLLLAKAEERAREDGATEIALDTSEQAHHLIALYERRGYRIVERTKWEEVNYASVIMSKAL
jgi:GNAT superfamily N-acetyltransferase